MSNPGWARKKEKTKNLAVARKVKAANAAARKLRDARVAEGYEAAIAAFPRAQVEFHAWGAGDPIYACWNKASAELVQWHNDDEEEDDN
jgi:hypothetical protein